MTSPKLATTTTRGRMYRHPITGNEYPSVTTVLNVIGKGEALKHWAAGEVAKYAVNQKDNWLGLDSAAAIDLLKREPLRSLDRAASRGTDVHAIAETYARTGTMPTWAEAINGYVDALKRFFDEHQPQPVLIEQTVFNSEIGYAGSFDMVCKLEAYGDALIMLDYKTSKAIYPDVAAQLAAYANGTEYIDDSEQAQPMLKCERGVVVRFAVNGEYEVVEVDLAAGWQYFKAVRAVHAIPTKPLLLSRVKATTIDSEMLKQRAEYMKTRVKNIKDNYPAALQQLVALWSPTMPTFKTDHVHTVNEIRTIEKWLNECEADHTIPFVDGRPSTAKPKQPDTAPQPGTPTPYEGLEVHTIEVATLRARLNTLAPKIQQVAKSLAKEANTAKKPISLSGKPTMRKVLIVSFMLDALELGEGDVDLIKTILEHHNYTGQTTGEILGGLEIGDTVTLAETLAGIKEHRLEITYNNQTNLFQVEKVNKK